MAFVTPWAIGNGAEHQVEVARQQTFDATGGAEGVSRPGNLKVQPLSVPGTKVRVAPGGALLVNRYPGGDGQSYTVRNDAQVEVDVSATGSGGRRSDLVVARVLDPQYEGQPPTDPDDFDYARVEVIQGVSSSTKTARDLNLNYPAIALARIDLPASTGTVQSSHITDLRELAQPRRSFEVRTYALGVGDEDRLDASTAPPDGEVWPNAAVLAWDPGIWVPEWATRMRIVCTWAGIRQPPGYARANVWVQVGGYSAPPETRTQVVRYEASNSQNPERTMALVADEVAVLAAHRGSFQRFYPKGNRADNVGANSRPLLNDASAVVLQVDFFETAV